MKISQIDQTLLRFADSRSPKELSLLVDGKLSPEECAARVTALLEESDWLSLAQQDALVTMKMRVIVSELEAMPRTARNAEVLLSGLKSIGDRLDRRLNTTEADLQRLYAWQGELLIDALSVMLGYLRKNINELESVGEEKWASLVNKAIERAGVVISSKEINA